MGNDVDAADVTVPPGARVMVVPLKLRGAGSP